MAKLRRTSVRTDKPAKATAAVWGNPIVAQLAGLTENKRLELLQHVHPLYATREQQYRLLLDAYEGSGGFATGGYLWKYPNEKPDEFAKRQAQARYHNYVRSLVNIYVRHVYRTGVQRTAEGLPDLEAWWQNVDGAGTPMSEFMKRGAKLALAGGLAGALVDKDPIPPSGPSRADDRGRVVASWFASPTIVDWDVRAGALTGVKLLEQKQRESILDPTTTGAEAVQYLIWTQDAWARFDHEGQVVNASGDGPGAAIGVVPLAIVRPDPSAEHPFLGHALIGDGSVVRALYNRCSEEDEILRDQAFSQLTVNVPPEGDVEEVKRQIGNDIGTTTAIVAKGDVKYVTADMAAPEQVRKNIEFLVREIYRMAHVRYERDSLDAESAEAIQLQHTELNEMLAHLAAELAAAEWQMVKFWFLWTRPGDVVTALKAFEAARPKISIEYPHEFFVTDLLTELEKWAKAIALELGLEFEHWAKKRVVGQLAPEMAPEIKQRVFAEIDTQLSNREQAIADARARLAGMGERLTSGDKPQPPGGGGGRSRVSDEDGKQKAA